MSRPSLVTRWWHTHTSCVPAIGQARRSVFRGEIFGHYETIEPSGSDFHVLPAVHVEIEHSEGAGRKGGLEASLGIAVAVARQGIREFGNSWIVADNEEGANARGRPAQGGDQSLDIGVVKPGLDMNRGFLPEFVQHALKGFARALRVRYDRGVGQK